MIRTDLTKIIYVVFQICDLEMLIKEYEDRMKEQNEPGQCNKRAPETPES